MITISPTTKSYIFDRGYCHNKINQIGQQSRINLTSVLQEKHSKILSLPKIDQSFNKKTVKKTKAHSRRYSHLVTSIYENPEFDDLEKQKIEKSQFLSKKIKQLKEMQLLQKNRLKLIKFENQSKQGSILNDFHSPKTNGGYSRSKTGGLYYK